MVIILLFLVPVASQAAGKMKLRSVTEIGILTILACLKEISGRAIIYGVTLPSMSISGLDVLVKAFEVMSKALSGELSCMQTGLVVSSYTTRSKTKA